MRFLATVGAETIPVEVLEDGGRYRVRVGEEWLEVDAHLDASGVASLLCGGVSYLCDFADERGETVVTLAGERHRIRLEDAEPVRWRGPSGALRPTGERLTAPMPGRVVAVHVAPGDRVAPGAPLVTLEAMKMENEFRAATGGVVTAVHVTAGQAVNAGDLLVVVGAESGSP